MRHALKNFWLWFSGIAFVLLLVYRFSPFFLSRMNLKAMNHGPSFEHFLGTDSLGRDMASRISSALWETVLPVFGTSSLSMLFALAAALLLFSYPALRPLRILFGSAGALVASLPLTVSIFFLLSFELASPWVIILIAAGICIFFKTFSDLDLLLKRDEHLAFWESHQAMGGASMQRIFTYGISQAWAQELLGLWANYMRLAIIIEASLSYLGFGVSEPSASIGNMIAMHFSKFIHGNIWTVTVLSLSFLLVFGFVDAVRTIVDRKMRRAESC